MELGAVAKPLYQQATAVKGRTSFCAPNNCCYLECYVPVPILVLDGASLSRGRKPGPMCLTLSVQDVEGRSSLGCRPAHGPRLGCRAKGNMAGPGGEHEAQVCSSTGY